MATAIDDLPAQATLAASLTPTDIYGPVNGSAVELPAGDGRGFAVLVCGEPFTAPVTAKVQTSADGSTWTDAAAFPAATAVGVLAIGFAWTGRLARVAVTAPAGGAWVAALIGQQRKLL